MCGISGIATLERDRSGLEAMASAMSAAVAHRGPDGNGIWSDDGIALAHRRLSIIDLSPAGAQPMTSADGRYVMVCNGEIYNYKDIRRRFEADGYPFRSNTDVEVILPLFERYGERCVEHLAGMFAFAVWDQREHTLFLARDRVGEKPLYFWTGAGAIAFCSEVKGLLVLPLVQRKLEARALAFLQVFQSVPAPLTMFEGIEALPPATTLTWVDGRRRVRRYWHLDFSHRRRWGWREAIDAYDANLRRSVGGCLVADVPLGITLSGGVDSSTVALMASQEHSGIRSFCVGHAPNNELDIEHTRATHVASILGLQHKNIHFPAPSLGDLSRVIRQYDQPIWCGVVLYADRLAEAMRQEVKVAVSGNGADEVLAGYAPYARLPIEEAARRLISLWPEKVRRCADGWRDSRLTRFAQSSSGAMTTWRAKTLRNAAQQQIRRLCTPAWADRLCGVDVGEYVGTYAEECQPQSYLDTIIYTDLMAFHQHSHCIIPDVSGMSYGLEIRAPFLDHRLIEFAASLPTHMLLSRIPAHSRTKHIAKRYLAKFLPSEIVNARKIGFGYAIPLNELVLKAEHAEVRRRLTKGSYLDLGIFAREGAEWALANSTNATWMLLSFASWVESYL